MKRALGFLIVAFALAATPSLLIAQDTKSKTVKVAAPKVGKGEKLCSYRFPSGEKRSWVCKKEEPCCAWDAISYVKCGSTITGCL
jgi:hypothetical protein